MAALLSFAEAYFYAPIKDAYTPSYDALTRDSNYVWPAQQRINRDPAHQWTGPGEDNVTIEGVLYPHLFGGLTTLEVLRMIARRGTPYPLIRYVTTGGMTVAGPSPDGTFLAAAFTVGGNPFVLKRVQQKETYINSRGQVDKVEFSLELSLYGDDGFNSLQIGLNNPVTAGAGDGFQVGQGPTGDN